MIPMYNPFQRQAASPSTGTVGVAAWSFMDDSLYYPAEGAHHLEVLPPITTFQGNCLDETSSHSFLNQSLPGLPAGSILPQCQWAEPPSSSRTVDHCPDSIKVDLLPDCRWLWDQFYAAETEMILTKAGRYRKRPLDRGSQYTMAEAGPRIAAFKGTCQNDLKGDSSVNLETLNCLTGSVT